MTAGASYAEVAERGFIFVDPLPWRMTISDKVQKEFHEEMEHLAHSMATMRVEGKGSVLNKPLHSALRQAFYKVKRVALLTRDQIHSQGQYQSDDSLVFLLHPPQQVPAMRATVAKPQKGRLVLFPGPDGELYIPVPTGPQAAVFVPFRLTAEDVESIAGPVGKNLREAFHLGMKDILRHHTDKRRIQREEATYREAGERIEEIMHAGRTGWRNEL